jgi:hypothetical protein
VIAERARRQAKEDDVANVIVGVLQDLKSANEKVTHFRFFLSAHPTAMTLEQKVSSLVEARELLLRAQQERYILGSPLEDLFETMLDYLSELAGEFRDNYELILVESLKESEQRDRIRSGDVVATELSGFRLTHDVARFPRTAEFATRGTWSTCSFSRAYKDAKHDLTQRVRRVSAI